MISDVICNRFNEILLIGEKVNFTYRQLVLLSLPVLTKPIAKQTDIMIDYKNHSNSTGNTSDSGTISKNEIKENQQPINRCDFLCKDD